MDDLVDRSKGKINHESRERQNHRIELHFLIHPKVPRLVRQRPLHPHGRPGHWRPAQWRSPGGHPRFCCPAAITPTIRLPLFWIRHSLQPLAHTCITPVRTCARELFSTCVHLNSCRACARLFFGQRQRRSLYTFTPPPAFFLCKARCDDLQSV